MRCKKHPSDFSSSVGVCASCLRERLCATMAAQAQAQLRHSQLVPDRDVCRKSDTHHPPSLAFPRSVSPYISRRKSDTTDSWHLGDRRFYSTPQVGPTGSIPVEVKSGKKNSGRRFFSFFSGLFRSKSDSDPVRSSDPGVSGQILGHNSRDPYTSSPSWFSAIIPNRRKKTARAFSLDATAIGEQRRNRRNRGGGMSPARFSDDEDGEHFPCRLSGYSSESSQGWRQTPRRTPASLLGGVKAAHNNNMSGLTFCLSPLVRASPSRHRNQKCMQSESIGGGDVRASPKRHLSAASSLGINGSRKLADFGRYNPKC